MSKPLGKTSCNLGSNGLRNLRPYLLVAIPVAVVMLLSACDKGHHGNEEAGFSIVVSKDGRIESTDDGFVDSPKTKQLQPALREIVRVFKGDVGNYAGDGVGSGLKSDVTSGVESSGGNELDVFEVVIFARGSTTVTSCKTPSGANVYGCRTRTYP